MAEQPKSERSTASPTTLNDLPKNVLVHILSFLPLIYAIEASLISRKWRNLWHSIPSLAFDITHPVHTVPSHVQGFAEFITQTLLNRPNSIPLRKFQLVFNYCDNHRYRSLVSSWLRYALHCNADDVELNFDAEDDDGDEENENTGSGRNNDAKSLYDFHFFDLKNRSVKCLSLWFCEIVVPSNELIRFDSLRVLLLTGVEFDDESLSKLISRCGNLERLLLREFVGLKKFRIFSESLKVLELSCYCVEKPEHLESSVEIRTPNLSKIEILVFYVAISGDLSSVVEAELVFTMSPSAHNRKCWSNAINLLSGVKNLKIESCFPVFMNSEIQPGECSEFKRLKHLEMKTTYSHTQMLGLSFLLERSPALETLVLDYCVDSDSDSDEEAIFFDNYESQPFLLQIPSLQEVKMKHFRKTNAEYFTVTLFGIRNGVLKKIVMVPPIVRGPSQPVVLDMTTDDWKYFSVRGIADNFRRISGHLMDAERKD